MFIMLDGIDGSGKSTVLAHWISILESEGKKIFQMRSYWKEHKQHPKLEELENYDIIITGEPTYAWVGAAIREEMIQHGVSYSPISIATAFSLDRMIMYKRLILPLLAKGKTIIQDRGVSTSLCYQSIQDNSLTIEAVANLEGNAFTLEHAPEHLVIVDLPPEIAILRINQRSDKQDNAIFEKLSFLQKARAQFLNPEYQNYFLKHNTKIHILNSDSSIGIMKENSANLLKNLIVNLN